MKNNFFEKLNAQIFEMITKMYDLIIFINVCSLLSKFVTIFIFHYLFLKKSKMQLYCYCHGRVAHAIT